uniref:Secreted protein n=1 Tax=Parascaris univalens TaxID=6257 RepID=A0A915A6M2_PARUN
MSACASSSTFWALSIASRSCVVSLAIVDVSATRASCAARCSCFHLVLARCFQVDSKASQL